MESDSNLRGEVDRSETLSKLTESGTGQLVKYAVIAVAYAFSTPLESWLRYDFGERYYTRASYVSGVITMYLWYVIMSILGLLFFGTPASGAEGIIGTITAFVMAVLAKVTFQNYNSNDLFGGLFYILWYGHVILGLYHFYRMWYRNRTGQALHSFDHGKSRLKFIAKLIFKPLNILFNALAKTMAITIPPRLRKNEERITPVFYDQQNFTQEIIEPGLVIGLGIYFFFNGYALLGIYLLFAGLGIRMITRMGNLGLEKRILDMRDQFIDQGYMSDMMDYANAHEGKAEDETKKPDSQKASVKAEYAAWQVSEIIEKNPDLADKVKREDPSLFDMMEDINPNLQKMGKDQSPEQTNDNL